MKAATLESKFPILSVDAYKSANNWKEYADRIVGYDF